MEGSVYQYYANARTEPVEWLWYEALQQRSSFESLSGYMDTSGGAVPATVSEELAASISMREQEKKRETLFGTIIGNGGDDDVRNNE